MIDAETKRAVSVLISAADARRQQWEGVAEGERPDALIDELWEVGKSAEAEGMAIMIENAIETARKWLEGNS